MQIIAILAWIICSLLVWWLYHRIFSVVYFTGKAILGELIIMAIMGFILLTIIVMFWYIAIPIIIILVIIAITKKQ